MQYSILFYLKLKLKEKKEKPVLRYYSYIKHFTKKNEERDEI
jgi:hypothetical protein